MSCDYSALSHAGILSISPYQAGKPIEELQRELGLEKIIKLASNENPLGPSPKAIQMLVENEHNIHHYPDANGYNLKLAISELHNIEMSQITLGNGSNDVLDLLVRAYVQAGDEIIYSQYAFIVYELLGKAANAKRAVIPAKNWGHDLSAMLAAITAKTKIIFIANPNNPTGTALKTQELLDFVAKVPEHVIVVVDEAYAEYHTDPEHQSVVSAIKDFSNLVVTRTFSKAYGLAALRVGYAVSNDECADLLNRIRQPFNVNLLGQRAAVAAINDQEHVARTREHNQQALAQLSEGLQALGLDYIPSFGNFVSVNIKGNAVELFKKLLLQAVIVRPLTEYNMPGFLRISVGTTEENAYLLQCLQRVMSS